jgi:hypothetical protein
MARYLAQHIASLSSLRSLSGVQAFELRRIIYISSPLLGVLDLELAAFKVCGPKTYKDL